MKTVRVSTSTPIWPWLRQTPQSSGVWGECRFVFDEHIEECDAWIVYDGLSEIQRCRCSPSNIIFFGAEPPNVKKYNRHFLKQFELVRTADPNIRHPNPLFSHLALSWHVGIDRRSRGGDLTRMIFDDFQSSWPIPKSRAISVVASDKAFTEQHAKRLAFVHKLKSHFGSGIDVFGRGIQEVGDKWDAIAPYKYHVVLENFSIKDYWTEKMSDCYLAGALPIYWGCKNIGDYFAEDSFVRIDIDDDRGAIETIQRVLDEDPYDNHVQSLYESRDRVLNRYNLFAEMERMVAAMPQGRKKQVVLLPEKIFKSTKRAYRRKAKVLGLSVSARVRGLLWAH